MIHRSICVLALVAPAAFFVVQSPKQVDTARTEAASPLPGFDALLASPTTASLQSNEDTVAPAGTWQVEGGAINRARMTASTPVIEGPLEKTVTIDPGGELEAEPVFDQETLITVRSNSKGQKILQVWNLETGRPIGGEKTFETTARIAPCFVDGELAVRAEDDSIEVHRLGTSGLRRIDRIREKGVVMGHPLLVGDSVVVPMDDSLVRRDVRVNDPVWKVEGAFRGHVAFSDGKIYAVEYDTTSGMCRLAVIDFATGEVKGRHAVGRGAGGVPELPGEDRVSARGLLAFVQTEKPLGVSGGIKSNSVGIDLSKEANAVTPAAILGSTFMTEAPAILGRGWLGFYDHPIEGEKLVATLSPPEGMGIRQPTRLSGKGWHQELLKHPQSPAFAREVSYFGGLAWDATTSRILWRQDDLDGPTLYPCEKGVIAVRDGRSIEIWRPTRDIVDGDEVVPSAPPTEPGKGLLILRDGKVVEGELRLRASERSNEIELVGGSSTRRYLDRDSLFAALDDGTLLYAADSQALVEGLRRLGDRVEVESLDKVLGLAAKSGDPKFMRKVLIQARRLRMEDLDELQEAYDVARKLDEPDISRRNLERAEERFAEVGTARGDLYWKAVESIWDDGEEVVDDWGDTVTRKLPRRQYRLLELVLDADPGFEPAREKLEELLPDEIDLPANRRVVEWVEFAEVNAYHPVEIWWPTDGMADELTWEQDKLEEAQIGWRDDLTGYRSERIFIITPLKRPGGIARCMHLAEQLCDIMEGMFAGGTHERDLQPMVILLFETRMEYIEQSTKGDPGSRSIIAQTAGVYTPSEKVSRLFLPDETDDGAWADMIETLLHELTHHWVDCRNERIPESGDTGSGRTAGLPGYWIVEGFASTTQFFLLDPFVGTYETVNPRGNRIDVIANARDDQLLPWKLLFRRPHNQLWSLGSHSFDQFPLTWTLGGMQQPGGVGLFYAQAATVSQFLYNADNGRRRDQLYDYVINYYTSNEPQLSIQEAFGMSEDQLGQAAVDWARQVVAESLRED
jgi:hypothetical protein